METSRLKIAAGEDRIATYADMFTALGAEPRLKILRALLASHPDGMVVGEIQNELSIAPSTLSHHLEKLKNEDLITPLTPPFWKSCWGSFTPSAVPATKRSSPRRSLKSANRRDQHGNKRKST
jgi:hypothetical protein